MAKRIRSACAAILGGIVAVAVWAAPACAGRHGSTLLEPTGGAGGAGGPAGGHGAGGLGAFGAGGGAVGGAGACLPDCTAESAISCNSDETAVVECTNVGTQANPCLQWQEIETCHPNETCQGGVCVGCCAPAGTGCCAGDYSADCCAEADACLMVSMRNGSEVCDDGSRNVDPSANRYLLICLNARGGIAYAAHNSGPACGSPTIPRCQCWEQQGQAPWDHLQYIQQTTCDHAGKRVEVIFPSAGNYYVGVHPPPGSYNLGGYCPTGNGCMTCVGLLEIPR